ncbi:ATP/GTP-binding protein [Streptomyces heilongjiangensis]|uniref:ATP/GTP-binding protein n=1 Tax=Streptomyces heilongjiangensis TaxID=945052 RepID=A0ABW1BFN3_9ACTN|nr:ATP/GTP-binding protein [Streptomyces heilongjiangensis]MDC2950178.1 ATP/GTP-binding protein [Streptomyces heilongjiangensis]
MSKHRRSQTRKEPAPQQGTQPSGAPAGRRRKGEPADEPAKPVRRHKRVPYNVDGPVVHPTTDELTTRGWTGPGGGQVGHADPPSLWRATTVQACGLWPFAASATAPTTGVPLGPHLRTGTTVCGDPISWFARANYLSNPSMFMLGMPGLGKSTLVNRMLIGLAATGVVPMVLGDLKPDYAETVRALGGQVIRIGRGVGGVNVLDPGAMGRTAHRIGGRAGEALAAEAHGRVLNTLTALISVVRSGQVDDHEQAILSVCLNLLTERHAPGRPPTLPDLIRVLDEGPPRLRSVALDRGQTNRYQEAVDPLLRSLIGILSGALGSCFAGESTTRMDLDAPAVCMDISRIGEADTQLTAAAMLASWSDGLGAVAAASALADAGLAPQRWYLTVLDELWRPLRAASGIVNRIDALTRLNRTMGVGSVMITHTLKDAAALDSSADRAKADGLAERAGMVVCAGLPERELEDLSRIVHLSRAEIDLVSSWSSPEGWNTVDSAGGAPGRGKFLIKVGGRPGVPFRLAVTRQELALHDTSARWSEEARAFTAPAPTAPELTMKLYLPEVRSPRHRPHVVQGSHGRPDPSVQPVDETAWAAQAGWATRPATPSGWAPEVARPHPPVPEPHQVPPVESTAVLGLVGSRRQRRSPSRPEPEPGPVVRDGRPTSAC